MSLYKALFAMLVASLLSACGGGSSTAPVVQGPNPFDSLAGRYSTGCTIDLPDGARGVGIPGTSIKVDLTVTATVGKQTAETPARVQLFDGTTCVAGSVTLDITAMGTASMLSQTKTYAAPSPKTGTAKVAEFKYSGLTLSKGTLADLGLTSLPLAGVTTKIAYLSETNKLYFSAGSRGSDGLGMHLSSLAGVKQ